MPTSSYDVVVIGDDLAGLVAAALCARRGLRVLRLVGTGGREDYLVGDHHLPITPRPFLARTGVPFSRIAEELQIDHDLKRQLGAEDLRVQLVGPDCRIDLTATEARLAKAFDRELGSDDGGAMAQVTPLSSLVDDLFRGAAVFPPVGFWKRREAGKLTHALDEATTAFARLRAERPALYALLETMAALDAGASGATPLAIARTAALIRNGIPAAPRALTTACKLIEEKFAHHGGETSAKTPRHFEVSWNKITTIELDSGDTIGTQQVIWAMPLEHGVKLFDDKRAQKFGEAAAPIDIAGYDYTLNLVVDQAAIPEGMAPLVYVRRDLDAPCEGDNAFAIHLAAADDAGRITVSLSARIATADVAPGPRELAQLRGRLIDRIEEVMPFLAAHVEERHSPYEDSAGQTSRPVAELRPRYRPDGESLLGVAGVPYQLGLKNLVVASSQSLPGLGLEGHFVAGFAASELVTGATKKRGLRDDVVSRA